MMDRGDRQTADPAYVVLVRGIEEVVVYEGGLGDCQAWLALNGDKPIDGEGHFELREGLAPAR